MVYNDSGVHRVLRNFTKENLSIGGCLLFYINKECAVIKAKGASTVKVFRRRRTVRQPVQPVPSSESIVYDEVELLYARGVQQAAHGPQPGPPSHLVWPLPTLRFFPLFPIFPTHWFIVYMKKLNFSCGPATCVKLVIWPTDKKCCTPLLYAKSGEFTEDIVLSEFDCKLQKLFQGLVMTIKTILNTPFSQAVVMEECFRHCLFVGKRRQELKQHNKQFVLDHRSVTEEQCTNIWRFVRHALKKKMQMKHTMDGSVLKKSRLELL